MQIEKTPFATKMKITDQMESDISDLNATEFQQDIIFALIDSIDEDDYSNAIANNTPITTVNWSRAMAHHQNERVTIAKAFFVAIMNMNLLERSLIMIHPMYTQQLVSFNDLVNEIEANHPRRLKKVV